MPYKQAVQRRRERQRMAKGMKQIAAIGGAVGPPKQLDMLAGRTALDPARARALNRAAGIARKKRDQEAEREAQEAASDEPAPEPRSLRPPRLEAGRYAGLKNEQPS